MCIRDRYGTSQAALLFEQAGKEVLDVQLLMAVAGGLALGRPDRLLEFFRETIDVHVSIVDRQDPLGMWAGRQAVSRAHHSSTGSVFKPRWCTGPGEGGSCGPFSAVLIQYLTCGGWTDLRFQAEASAESELP